MDFHYIHLAITSITRPKLMRTHTNLNLVMVMEHNLGHMVEMVVGRVDLVDFASMASFGYYSIDMSFGIAEYFFDTS